MIAYEVLLNGERLCLAGVGSEGVLTTILSWTGRANLKHRNARLSVGGLVDREHVRWTGEENQGALDVSFGDEITIRVIEAQTVDEPRERYTRESRNRHYTRSVEHLKTARALLTESIDSEVAWELYEKHLANEDLKSALFFLADLGTVNNARPAFWRELLSASTVLSKM